MELMVISAPTPFKTECDLINQLFEAGLQVLHLRKENAEEAVYRQVIEGILPDYYTQIALHHCHSIARDYNINRIHHTENFRKNNTEHLGVDKIFSTSIHSIQDSDAIKAYDYSFFGPVFNSLSKPGYQSTVGKDFKFNKMYEKPKIIALGGIGVNQIDQLKEMNFDGAALLGSIWNDPSQAISNFKKIQAKCRAYH